MVLSRVTKQSRKGISPFSPISSVNCKSAFCLLRFSSKSLISSFCTAVNRQRIVARVVVFVCKFVPLFVFWITISATTMETGEPTAVPCIHATVCNACRCIASKHTLKKVQ